jgi:hypothetical protein
VRWWRVPRWTTRLGRFTAGFSHQKFLGIFQEPKSGSNLCFWATFRLVGNFQFIQFAIIVPGVSGTTWCKEILLCLIDVMIVMIVSVDNVSLHKQTGSSNNREIWAEYLEFIGCLLPFLTQTTT